MKSLGCILVTGGCGYIGSHVVRHLSEGGRKVVVIDNLSTGFEANLVNNEILYKVDLANEREVDRIIKKHRIETVIHFAASIVSPESILKPIEYYENNVVNTVKLLKSCLANGVKNFIQSSTAAVYGPSKGGKYTESSLILPQTPYGQSKLMCEKIIADVCRSFDLNAVVLRYFNVAGADPLGRMGQRSPNATHLIKVSLNAALGIDNKVKVYGNDYDTRDGSCIRDYIHVEDLSEAHVKSIEFLERNGGFELFNCGYGKGYTVNEVISAVSKVSGNPIISVPSDRRPGDLPVVIADNSKICKELGWSYQYDNLEYIVETALNWERKLRDEGGVKNKSAI